MAETPPQGSLLSNFLSGGGKNNRSFPFIPKKRTPLSITPDKLHTNQIDQLGATAAAAITSSFFSAFDNTISGLRDELVGSKIIKKFGNQERIIEMDYDYLTKALHDLDEIQVKDVLGLSKKEDFISDYLNWRTGEYLNGEDGQGGLNKKRAEGNKPPLEGFGNYQVLVSSSGLPIEIGNNFKNIIKQDLALRASQLINELSQNSEFPDISYLTKVEEAEALAAYINKKFVDKSKELDTHLSLYPDLEDKFNQAQKRLGEVTTRRMAREKELSSLQSQSPSRGNALLNQRYIQQDLGRLVREENLLKIQKQDLGSQYEKNVRPYKDLKFRLEGILQQHQADLVEKDSEKKTGYIFQSQKRLADSLTKKGVVKAIWDKANGLYSDAQRFNKGAQRFKKNPVGYLARKIIDRPLNVIKNSLKKNVVGKYIVRIFETAGWDVTKWGSNALSYGAKQFGRLVGRLVKTLAKQAAKIAVEAVMALAETIGVPIIAAVLIAVGVIAAVVLIFLMVIMPLYLSTVSDAQACGMPTNSVGMNSQQMLSYFTTSANKNCVDPAVLLAIAKRENGGRTFTYTDAEFQTFSQENWWASLPPGDPQIDRGACIPNGSGAVGIMQFLQGTFDKHRTEVQAQTGHANPNRCNAQDSIVAAALEIKSLANQGSNCSNWSDQVIKDVAGGYCYGPGSTNKCGNDPACVDSLGTNYCDLVNKAAKELRGSLGSCTSSGGVQSIVTAVLAIPVNSLCQVAASGNRYCPATDPYNILNPGWCLAYVATALDNAGYKPLSVGAANLVFGYALSNPSIGYLTIPPNKITGAQDFQKGDLIDWTDTFGGAGHIGIVVDVVGDIISIRSTTTPVGSVSQPAHWRNGTLITSGLSSSSFVFLGIIRATDLAKK